MKFMVKRNEKYLFVFLICFLIMLFGLVRTQNIVEILKRALFENGYKENFFLYQEDSALKQTTPTIINIIKHVFSHAVYSFDSTIIFSTEWFQIIIPLFSIICGIDFFNYYHSLFQMEVCKSNSYKLFIFKQLCIRCIKLSGSIFLSYFLFIIVVYNISSLAQLGADNRTLFADLLSNQFYVNHTFLYFVLEGSVRFFLIPFVYAFFCQSFVLLKKGLKEVIAAPIAYYYGLSAIGYATMTLFSYASLYLNPSILMANGSYDSFNSILIIVMNMIPLYIAIGIIWRLNDDRV